MKTVRGKSVWFAMVALLVAPTAMLADSFIDFNIILPETGAISYAGGVKPLVGKKIDVDSVTGIGTPLHPGSTFTLLGGLLNFTTGNLTSFTSGKWVFGGGGTITLTATCLDFDNDGGACDGGDVKPTTPLVSGTWDSAEVTTGLLSFRVEKGLFDDKKNAKLLTHFGIPATGKVYEGTINVGFLTSSRPPHAFRSTGIQHGALVNDIPTSVPEPAGLALLGTGLLGVAGLARRKYLGKR